MAIAQIQLANGIEANKNRSEIEAEGSGARVWRSAISAGSEIVRGGVGRRAAGRALAVADDQPTACSSVVAV